jgi:hypothetical protein
MTLSAWMDVFTVILAFLSFVVASLTFCYLLKFRSELALPEQIANIPEFLRKEYLERRFPPRVTKKFEWLHTLKDARLRAENELKPRDNEKKEDTRKRFRDSTLEEGGWQIDFAYELSLALEQVGVMVLAGAIPLGIVLAMNAPQIIEDWGYCSKFVEKKIRDKSLKPKKLMILPFIWTNIGWMDM